MRFQQRYLIFKSLSIYNYSIVKYRFILTAKKVLKKDQTGPFFLYFYYFHHENIFDFFKFIQLLFYKFFFKTSF